MEEWIKGLTHTVAVEKHVGLGKQNLHYCILTNVRHIGEEAREDKSGFKPERIGGYGASINLIGHDRRQVLQIEIVSSVCDTKFVRYQ